MSGIVAISGTSLDEFVDKSIVDICPLGFGTVGDGQNHCAHFVGHVLQLNSTTRVTPTCVQFATKNAKKTAAGACIRVNELYNACAKLEKPTDDGCLVYYTLKSNIEKDGSMGSMKQKHVGIGFQGFVYNYGNSKDKVRKDGDGVLAKLYGANTVTLYSAFPTGAKFLTLSDIQALVK